MPNRRQVLKQFGFAAGTLAAGVFSQSTAARGAERPRIKLGQIGVGHAHASKLSAYRQSPDYEVVGIVEPNLELRRKAESQEPFRDLRWMTQEQLLNESDLQAVLVETEVRDLLNTADACIAAGKHVHLDKPAGSNYSQYDQLLSAAEQKKLLVQMGYMYRYSPAILLLRDLLKRGWLGEPFEVHTVMSKVVPPDSRRELAEYSGGILFELGGHIIDLVIGVLGKPIKVTPYIQHVAQVDDRLADNMLAVCEYPRALASVKSSAVEVSGGDRRHLVVCGTEGTMHIEPLDDPRARLALNTARGEYRRGYQNIAFPKFTRYVADAADMARIIRGEKPSDFSYDHDRAVQSTLLAACGQPV